MFTVHPNESTFEKVIVNHVQVREHEGIEYMTIKDFPDRMCADLYGRLPMLCSHIEVRQLFITNPFPVSQILTTHPTLHRVLT